MTTSYTTRIPARTIPSERKLLEFRSLRSGWNCGDGEAFDSAIVDAASRFLVHLESYGYTETDVFPGSDGSISVKGYGRAPCIEVVVEPDGSFTFAVPGRGEFLVYIEGLSEKACVKKIASMVSQKRSTSESSIPGTISTVETSDYLASHLAARMERSLFSVSSVPSQLAKLCANT